jgi:hypothetical protein
MKRVFRLVFYFTLILCGVFFDYNKNVSASSNIYYDDIYTYGNVIVNNVDGLEIDFSGNLVEVGDYYELYFNIVNPSSVDMEISDYTLSQDNQFLSYSLTYSNGDEINIGDIVKSGESKRVKYRVYYKENCLENCLNSDLIIDNNFNIDYEQVI